MAKTTQTDWIKAKILFETGKSLSAINLATGIDRATVSKRAKKEGWIKGEHQQLIIDAARVNTELSTLEPQVLKVVEKEIDERTKHIQILNNMTLKNLAVMNKKVNVDFEMAEHKLFQETVNKASEQLLGKEPTSVNEHSGVVTQVNLVAFSK